MLVVWKTEPFSKNEKRTRASQLACIPLDGTSDLCTQLGEVLLLESRTKQYSGDSPTRDVRILFLKYYYHTFLEIISLRSGEIISHFGAERSIFREGESERRALQSKRDRQTNMTTAAGQWRGSNLNP